MHIKDVLLMTLVTIAFGGVATAVAFGIYSFGTWLFTFGRTFGIVSVCAITVVLLTVAVEVRLSVNYRDGEHCGLFLPGGDGGVD